MHFSLTPSTPLPSMRHVALKAYVSIFYTFFKRLICQADYPFLSLNTLAFFLTIHLRYSY